MHVYVVWDSNRVVGIKFKDGAKVSDLFKDVTKRCNVRDSFRLVVRPTGPDTLKLQESEGERLLSEYDIAEGDEVRVDVDPA
ncbi:hypothetical protein DIPPA_07993 [Diplonema papillatum]|nr:hypothetical protein DIPPA_07993 [Diplonema papillatum]